MTLVKVVKQGNSKVVVLPKIFLEFRNIKEGDLIDISDCFKVKKKVKK